MGWLAIAQAGGKSTICIEPQQNVGRLDVKPLSVPELRNAFAIKSQSTS
jgi:hypothetical protein